MLPGPEHVRRRAENAGRHVGGRDVDPDPGGTDAGGHARVGWKRTGVPASRGVVRGAAGGRQKQRQEQAADPNRQRHAIDCTCILPIHARSIGPPFHPLFPLYRPPDRLPRLDAGAGVARISGGDAGAGYRRPPGGGDRLSGLGAGELHGARLRPPSDRPRRHRRCRPRTRARARGPRRQATLARPDQWAAVSRPLPNLRLRGDRAHLLPRRQPRLLERHQPVLLRRRRAGAPLRGHRRAAQPALARGHRAAGRRRASTDLRRGRLRRALRLAVRDRHAYALHLHRGEDTVRAGALRPHQRQSGAPRRHPPPGGDGDREDLRRLPVSPLPLHRPRAPRRLGRPRAPRLGDDGCRRSRLRGRDRLRPVRRSRRA